MLITTILRIDIGYVIIINNISENLSNFEVKIV